MSAWKGKDRGWTMRVATVQETTYVRFIVRFTPLLELISLAMAPGMKVKLAGHGCEASMMVPQDHRELSVFTDFQATKETPASEGDLCYRRHLLYVDSRLDKRFLSLS